MGNIVIILQLIPSIIAALKAIEDAIPGSGMGSRSCRLSAPCSKSSTAASASCGRRSVA